MKNVVDKLLITAHASRNESLGKRLIISPATARELLLLLLL
jgi:hypothetical protein